MCFFRSLDYLPSQPFAFFYLYNTRALVRIFSIKLMDRVFKNACAQRSAYYGIISARKTAVSRVRIIYTRALQALSITLCKILYQSLSRAEREKKTFRRAPLYIYTYVLRGLVVSVWLKNSAFVGAASLQYILLDSWVRKGLTFIISKPMHIRI